MLSLNECSAKELKRLIGKLIRASMIMLGSIAFLKPLWSTLYSATRGQAILDKACKESLYIWIGIIYCCTDRLSIVKLLVRMPTQIYFTNTSGKAIDTYNFFYWSDMEFLAT